MLSLESSDTSILSTVRLQINRMKREKSICVWFGRIRWFNSTRNDAISEKMFFTAIIGTSGASLTVSLIFIPQYAFNKFKKGFGSLVRNGGALVLAQRQLI